MPYTTAMTPKQLRTFLDAAQLTQSGAARALEIDPRTMRRYVSGESEIPKVVELALYGLLIERKKERQS